MNGGGHAVFCWDVHLNDRGEVDAFLYLSSNGSMANGGSGGGVSVGGTSKGAGGFIGSRSAKSADGGADGAGVPEYFAHKSPLFVDDERYVVEGAWVTWDDTVADKLLTDMRARPKTRVKLAKRVKAARFFGIDVAQIPLFAMGQDAPAPFTPKPPDISAPEISTPRVTTPDDVAALQRRLKLLYLIGWSKADPGTIDGKSGKKTAAALVAFQRQNGLSADGKPSPLTLTKLDGVFRSAFDDPKAKQYLAPDRPSGLTFSDDDWQDSAALYFRHGVVRAEEPVDLILAGENLPPRPFDVTIVDADSQHCVSQKEYSLSPLGDRVTVTLKLPKSTAGCRLIARICDGEIATEAPLRVLPAAPTASS